MTKLRLIASACAGLAMSAVAGSAFADDAATPAAANAPIAAASSSPTPKDDSLTYRGITLYGTYDVGYAYQTHGSPVSNQFGPGLDYLISKSSNGAVSSFAPNGLSQSIIGVKGDIPLINNLDGIFKFDTGFDPLNPTHLTNGPQSVADANGVSLANQSSGGDSSRAGQLFNGSAFIGLQSSAYGVATYGRQNGLLADNVSTYDPNGASYAFSVIGFSGAASGIGDTQDARLDSSFKYINKIGFFRVGAQYQLSNSQDVFSPGDISGSATELDFGGDYHNFSADLTYSHKNNAVAVAALSATQAALLPNNSLAATISDDTSVALMAKYKMGPATLYGGFERIEYKNPTSPPPAGANGLGGYELSSLSVSNFNIPKYLNIYWTGLKYSITEKWDLTGAYYAYSQNNYSGTTCSDTSANGKCEGSLNAESIVAVYKAMKHLDLYGGVMESKVDGGLSNGYLNTSTISTMVGGRFTF